MDDQTPNTTNGTTTADIEQTKAPAPNQATDISKINIHKNDNGQWEAGLEYRDEDGKTITGETKAFDDFSQASAWVAGIEVDLKDGENVVS